MYTKIMTVLKAALLFTSSTAIVLGSTAAQAEPSSLFGDFGPVVRWLHLYSDKDGLSHIEEMPVGASPGPVGLTFLFNHEVNQAAVAYWPDGFSYDWHKPSRQNVSVYLQGTLVIETGDGRQHRITPGTAMLVEDLQGRGHRFRCEAKQGKKACLFVQLALAEPEKVGKAAAPGSRFEFDADSHPLAPEYSDPFAWAALPDRPDAADGAPPNDKFPDAQAEAHADVFFVHPTTYHDQHWNQPLDDAETNAWTDISVIARQASVFNACCKVYAPRYRQAVTGAYSDTAGITGDGQKAYDLAYQDVRAAFLFYLAHYNQNRPFILAGHSQGALQIERLIKEFIDGKPLQKRLIAAYAVGVGIPVGEFGRTYSSVTRCRKPADTGCIVSWNSYVSGGDPSSFRLLQEKSYLSRYGAEGKTLLCVNPLTFDMDQPVADAKADRGSLPGAPSLAKLPGLIAGAAAATCVDGVLMVDPPKNPAFTLRLLPRGSFHYHDIDTFYENVRANAVLRTQTFLRAELKQ